MDKDYMRNEVICLVQSNEPFSLKPATTKGFKRILLKCLPVLHLR